MECSGVLQYYSQTSNFIYRRTLFSPHFSSFTFQNNEIMLYLLPPTTTHTLPMLGFVKALKHY